MFSYGPRTVLDAGCGTGRVAIELARRGLEVVPRPGSAPVPSAQFARRSATGPAVLPSAADPLLMPQNQHMRLELRKSLLEREHPPRIWLGRTHDPADQNSGDADLLTERRFQHLAGMGSASAPMSLRNFSACWSTLPVRPRSLSEGWPIPCANSR